MRSRIKALVGFWEELRDCNAPRRHFVQVSEGIGTRALSNDEIVGERELFQPYRAPEPQIVPPPSYEESFADVPPEYTATDALAVAYFASLPLEGSGAERKQEQKSHAGLFERDTKVDLSAIEGIRNYANKKAKKAAKAAQQAKWADSDNEDKPEGEGGENGEGDGAGGGDAGGGAGGDPPGGGDGGDGGDDWFSDLKKKDVSIHCNGGERRRGTAMHGVLARHLQRASMIVTKRG